MSVEEGVWTSPSSSIIVKNVYPGLRKGWLYHLGKASWQIRKALPTHEDEEK